MYRYAQINDDGICFTVSQLSSAVNHPKLIKITEDMDVNSILGKKYENKEFVEVEEETEEDVE